MSLSTGAIIIPYTTESNITPKTIYTALEVPTTSSTIYDVNGNTLNYTITNVSESNGNNTITLTINNNSYVFSRPLVVKIKEFVGIQREVKNGTYGFPTTSFTFSVPSDATTLSNYVLYYAFYGCTELTSVDLSSLTTVSGGSAMYYAFSGCRGLTSVDLSSLTTVSGVNAMYYAFNGCSSLTSVDLSSLTTVSGTNALYYAFYNCRGLTSADLSSLTTVSGGSAMCDAFRDCTGLTSVDLSSLTTVSGSRAMCDAFRDCTGLTGVLDLSSLTTVSGGSAMATAFYGCTGLTSVNLSNLQTIGINSSSGNYGHFADCFNNCGSLTSITFQNLEKIYCTGGTTGIYGTFANNNKVQKMYFPKLDTITYGSGASTTNQSACTNIFYGCTSLTELHFAASNRTAIEASPGYSTAWGRGAGNVTIYFDL